MDSRNNNYYTYSRISDDNVKDWLDRVRVTIANQPGGGRFNIPLMMKNADNLIAIHRRPHMYRDLVAIILMIVLFIVFFLTQLTSFMGYFTPFIMQNSFNSIAMAAGAHVLACEFYNGGTVFFHFITVLWAFAMNIMALVEWSNVIGQTNAFFCGSGAFSSAGGWKTTFITQCGSLGAEAWPAQQGLVLSIVGLVYCLLTTIGMLVVYCGCSCQNPENGDCCGMRERPGKCCTPQYEMMPQFSMDGCGKMVSRTNIGTIRICLLLFSMIGLVVSFIQSLATMISTSQNAPILSPIIASNFLFVMMCITSFYPPHTVPILSIDDLREEVFLHPDSKGNGADPGLTEQHRKKLVVALLGGFDEAASVRLGRMHLSLPGGKKMRNYTNKGHLLGVQLAGWVLALFFSVYTIVENSTFLSHNNLSVSDSVHNEAILDYAPWRSGSTMYSLPLNFTHIDTNHTYSLQLKTTTTYSPLRAISGFTTLENVLSYLMTVLSLFSLGFYVWWYAEVRRIIPLKAKPLDKDPQANQSENGEVNIIKYRLEPARNAWGALYFDAKDDELAFIDQIYNKLSDDAALLAYLWLQAYVRDSIPDASSMINDPFFQKFKGTLVTSDTGAQTTLSGKTTVTLKGNNNKLHGMKVIKVLG